MSGRGKGFLVHPSLDASVKIGLTLGTSSATLSPSSPEPFYITVTARVLSTPDLSRPITLQTHPSPLEELSNRSFHSITCTTDSEKCIEIYPKAWPQYHWDSEDLRSAWDFLTIPPPGQGSYVVRHELRRDKIQSASLQKGERYRVRLTDKCLGTRWWAFKSLGELEGVRLKTWRGEDEAEMDRENPEWAKERRQEALEKFGDGPSCEGEEPEMLAMVVEGSDPEFEIV